MGVEKRKRLNDVEVPGKKARAAPAPENNGKTNNPAAAEEEEVEEFFAILRRIQVAVKYFGKVNGGESGGGGRKATAAVRPWNPSFRREDFEERAEAPETVVNTGLDLNTEPDCQPTSPDDKKPV
nr:NRR repressor homolog 1-like [Ipomoea batatas]